MSRKRLLITGASGFLGWNVCNAARSAYKVFGAFRTHPCEIIGVTPILCDLSQQSSIDGLFNLTRPDAVIHLAAAAEPNYCQSNESKAAAINIEASVVIARHCARRDIPCVFTSSDLVFDGKTPPYREEHRIAPVNIYGRQKATAERKMAAICPRIIICRMPLMYGDAPPHAKSILQPFIAALRSGSELRLFTDEFRTPLSARDAAGGLLLALEKAPPGTLHLGGPQRLSRYEMGGLIAEALGINASITPCLQRDVPMSAPRAADVSLVSAMANALGFVPGKMSDELSKLSSIRSDQL